MPSGTMLADLLATETSAPRLLEELVRHWREETGA
jgi:hypothetical protein